jgi:hypothetical protein
VIIHIHSDLLLVLNMGKSEAAPDLDLAACSGRGRLGGSDSKKRTDYSGLIAVSTGMVLEDLSENGRVNGDERGVSSVET